MGTTSRNTSTGALRKVVETDRDAHPVGVVLEAYPAAHSVVGGPTCPSSRTSGRSCARAYRRGGGRTPACAGTTPRRHRWPCCRRPALEADARGFADRVPRPNPLCWGLAGHRAQEQDQDDGIAHGTKVRHGKALVEREPLAFQRSSPDDQCLTQVPSGMKWRAAWSCGSNRRPPAGRCPAGDVGPVAPVAARGRDRSAGVRTSSAHAPVQARSWTESLQRSGAHGLLIQPVAASSRMLASMKGSPVRPSHRVWKRLVLVAGRRASVSPFAGIVRVHASRT